MKYDKDTFKGCNLVRVPDDISCGCGCFDYQWQTLEYYILGNKVMLNFIHYDNGDLITDTETIGQID